VRCGAGELVHYFFQLIVSGDMAVWGGTASRMTSGLVLK